MSDPTIPWYLSDLPPSELVSGADYPHAREEAEYWVKLLAEQRPSGCYWCARPWTEPAGNDRWIDGLCRQKNHHAGVAETTETEESELQEVGA